MPEEMAATDRLTTYSDAVFAVIVTVMELELKAPDQPGFLVFWAADKRCSGKHHQRISARLLPRVAHVGRTSTPAVLRRHRYQE